MVCHQILGIQFLIDPKEKHDTEQIPKGKNRDQSKQRKKAIAHRTAIKADPHYGKNPQDAK